ncbi:Transgelin, partial [Cladochytrium tenue]
MQATSATPRDVDGSIVGHDDGDGDGDAVLAKLLREKARRRDTLFQFTAAYAAFAADAVAFMRTVLGHSDAGNSTAAAILGDDHDDGDCDCDAPLAPQPSLEELHRRLRDGVLLCRLANALQPGCVTRVNRRAAGPRTAFLHMENISQFLDAARSFGLPSQDMFQTVDLYYGKDIRQ